MQAQSDGREAQAISMLDGIRRIDEIEKELELSSEKAVDELKASVLWLMKCLKARERRLALLIDKRRMGTGACLRQIKEELQRADELLREVNEKEETIEEGGKANVKELERLVRFMILDMERMSLTHRKALESKLKVNDVKAAIDMLGCQLSELPPECLSQAEPHSLTSFQEALNRIMEGEPPSNEMEIQKEAEKSIDFVGSSDERNCDNRNNGTGCDISQWLLSTEVEEQKKLENARVVSPRNRKQESNDMSQWLYRPASCHSSNYVMKMGVAADSTGSTQKYIESTKQGEIPTGVESLTVEETRHNWKNHEKQDITKWLLRPRFEERTCSIAFPNGNVSQTSKMRQDTNSLSQWLYMHTSPAGSMKSSTMESSAVLPKGGLSPAASLRVALEQHKATPYNMWLRQSRGIDNQTTVDMNENMSSIDNQSTRSETVRSDTNKEDYGKWLIQSSKSYLNTTSEDYNKWLATDSRRSQSLILPCNWQYNRKAFRKFMKHSRWWLTPKYDSTHPLYGLGQSLGRSVITSEKALNGTSGKDDISEWLLPSRCVEGDSRKRSMCSDLDFQESSVSLHLEDGNKSVTSWSASVSNNSDSQTCNNAEYEEFEVINIEDEEPTTDYD